MDTIGMDRMGGVPERTAGTGALRVRATGVVQGRRLDASALVSLEDQALMLAWEGGDVWRLALHDVDGLLPHDGRLTLYVSGGDVLELSGNDGLGAFAARALDMACTMPELTRGLRALGSERGAPGPAHDRWFAPLLAGRRAVSGVNDAERQVTLLDAANISERMQRTLLELAREQAPDHPVMQRALEAMLLEESASTFTALDRCTLAANALRASTPAARLAEWRRWLDALRDVFVAADSCWPRCAKVLASGV